MPRFRNPEQIAHIDILGIDSNRGKRNNIDMSNAVTPEQILDAARKQRGVTKAHLARVVGMNKDNFIKALRNWNGLRLNDERRAIVARELGIPDAVIQSWGTSSTSNEAA